MNGIGPLVRAWVHERNAMRHAAPAAPAAATGTETSGTAEATPTAATDAAASPTTPAVDTATFSASALARFEAWKAKHAAAPEPMPTAPPTIVDVIDIAGGDETANANGEPV